jgi:iron complex transport system ATP-binding protein
MPLIKVREAVFSYGEKPILNGIDLDLEKGELYCLMGPNGCGKSTLLDCILGINQLCSGEIFIDNVNIKNYKPIRLAQKMSYVPQVHDRSFPYKVSQVVLMGRTAHLSGFDSPDYEDETIAMKAMKQVGIAHLSNRPYTQISGGEMQMVILARALVQKTPIIIMDEPTAHLDFKNELLFLETVVKLIRQGDISVIMATHSPNQAFYFENQGINVKVAVMHNGNICATGKPNNILSENRIKELYGIEAKILSQFYKDGIELRQIIPLRTLIEKEV